MAAALAVVTSVTVNGQLKGWKWATQDKVRSWGTNLVAGAVNGGTGIGSVLDFTFSKSGTANEGALSGGDSGGGVFIDVGGKWELAGINYLVDGPFSLTSSGSKFSASLFDKGGLYVQGKLTPDTSADVPGNWYATRISSRASWIKSIIGTHGVGIRVGVVDRRYGRGTGAGKLRIDRDRGDSGAAASAEKLEVLLAQSRLEWGKLARFAAGIAWLATVGQAICNRGQESAWNVEISVKMGSGDKSIGEAGQNDLQSCFTKRRTPSKDRTLCVSR